MYSPASSSSPASSLILERSLSNASGSSMPFAFFTSQNYENYARTLLNLINMKKEFIHNKIVEGQKYIEQNHSPEVIGKQWIELENKV